MAVENIQGLLGNTSWAHLEIEGVADELRVTKAVYTEAFSQPAYATIRFATYHPDLNLDALLKQPASLIIDGTDNAPGRLYHGNISSISQTAQDRNFTHYEAQIDSAIAFLNKRKNVRIFQHKNELTIIRQILKEHAITNTEFKLMGHYPERDYCVQYNETDLAFIQRLMSEAGVYSFITHDRDQHRLIVTDHSSAHPALENTTISYHSATGQRHDESVITNVSRSLLVTSAKASATDYQFKNPALDLYSESSSPGIKPDSNHNKANLSCLTHYQYPGTYLDPYGGRQKTLNNNQAEFHDQTHIRGEGTVKSMLAGFKFNLKFHPDNATNTEYLITEVTHHIDQPQVLGEEASDTKRDSYSNTFKAIPAAVPYKMQPLNKPIINGTQTAIVTGPEGEEIYVDEYARVKVQFHWDRKGLNDGNSSCWIRVGQSWAGNGFGAVAIPRIGQEVIVDFINGDPDRPIITGSVYHGTNRSPYGLPENKTRTVFKTDTHKNDGSNEIRLEDLSSQEEIYFHAQKDQNNVVNNDETTTIGNNRTEDIGNDETQTIGHDRSIDTTNDENRTIGNDQRTTIQCNNQIKVGRNRQITIEKDQIETVNNHKKQTTYVNHWQETGGHYEHVVEGKVTRESVEQINLLTSDFEDSSADKLILKGPAGTITIDNKGITLKASNIQIKAPSVSFTGGGSHDSEKFTSDAAVGQAIDELVHSVLKQKPVQISNKAVPNQPPQLKQQMSVPAPVGLQECTFLDAKKKTLQERKDLIKQSRTKANDPATPLDEKKKLNEAADRLEENNVSVERARLADYVYPSNHMGDDSPVGWEKIDMKLPPSEQLKDNKKNFHAELFKSKIDGSVILSFKGTNNLSDWGQNLIQGTGGKTYQYNRAMKLAKKMKGIYGNKLQFSGHSLGGGLASAAAAVTGNPAYTYNSAGLHPNTPNYFGGSLATANKVTKSWHVEGEILTMAQQYLEKLLPLLAASPLVGQTGAMLIGGMLLYTKLRGHYGMPDATGTLKTLPATRGGGPLARHGIDHVIEGIEQQKDDDKATMQQLLVSP